MSYIFTVDGWMDHNDNRHSGEPKDLDDTFGVWVSVSNTEDDEDNHMFWAYVYEPFEEWSEWWVYIGALMEAHGMSL